MKSIIILFLATFVCGTGNAQNTFYVIVKDKITDEPLTGVAIHIPELEKGNVSDENGMVIIPDIPDGIYSLQISYLGYETLDLQLAFPLAGSLNHQTLYLSPDSEEMEEITISSTRSSRTIEDIPTRVEYIAGEELAEKGNMKPGEIRMLLYESTGIQTQQTSATSYNSSIRIQGLDGRYTQLLRDGLPLYAGFSGGLSLMQIAPLDLKRVEVIKGATSTLYGGGAMAGLVNLISKTPEEQRELSFMANGTSALGLDLSGFYSEKFSKTGTTIFASYNKGTPYDPADIGLTAIPGFDRFTLNPKLFIYFNDRTELYAGTNIIFENRLGGNMDYVKGKQPENAYFEENETARISTQLGLEHRLTDYAKIEVKNSVSHYQRTIEIPGYIFSGTQRSSFSEINFSHVKNRSEWVMGLNLWTDKFIQSEGTSDQPLDYRNATLGVFLQNTWNTSEKISIETGFRTDYQSEYGFITLPRISVMYKPDRALTFRLGGGLGYRTPTIFSEETERLHFRNVLPIDVSSTTAEHSIGGNLDMNYKAAINEDLLLTTNILLFYTRINDPLVLSENTSGFFQFLQPDGYVDTKGVEMNMKLTYRHFKLFSGYTYSNVNEHYRGNTTPFPLVARHRLNNVLMYEREESLWIGFEAYYFSPQKLGDGQTGRSYWILGLMTEKMLGEHFSIFLNFENFLDARQTAFDTIFTGSIDDPRFRDIYAPVDGFIINGGFKIKL
ncbi:MAG: TonB-dependent receptor [Cyclobacteriaceae bacterium]|nr:TonB-dependent receptor [Cyclobacteriaceae bacterium]